MSTFRKASSVLAYVKGFIYGSRCHTTRKLSAAHFGSGAQKNV